MLRPGLLSKDGTPAAKKHNFQKKVPKVSGLGFGVSGLGLRALASGILEATGFWVLGFRAIVLLMATPWMLEPRDSRAIINDTARLFVVDDCMCTETLTL